MQEKIKLLTNLLTTSTLQKNQIMNKIVQTIQRTEDISKAKVLKERIMNGNFSRITEGTIDDLIKAFSPVVESKVFEKQERVIKINTNQEMNSNKDLNMEFRIKELEELLAESESKAKEELEKRLQAESLMLDLMCKLNINDRFELVTVTEEEIQKKYTDFLIGDSIQVDLSLLNKIILKEYYKIK